jgi:hypothetical protein
VSLLQLEFFAEEELIQIVPNCSVPNNYIDGILVSTAGTATAGR